MKTFSNGTFTPFYKKWPRGRAFYQISPDVALTTCVQKLPITLRLGRARDQK